MSPIKTFLPRGSPRRRGTLPDRSGDRTQQLMIVPESQAIEVERCLYANACADQSKASARTTTGSESTGDRITARLVAQAIQYRRDCKWIGGWRLDPNTLNAWAWRAKDGDLHGPVKS